MTRQLEQEIEIRAARHRKAVIHAIYGGLDSAIEADGYELSGFSAKLAGGDCLLTLRASNAAGGWVAFVGASDLPDAFVKCVREARAGELRWREDRYAK